jgi:hypothetical protein
MSFYHNVHRTAGGTYFLVRALWDVERVCVFQSKPEKGSPNRSFHYLHSNSVNRYEHSMSKKIPYYMITTEFHGSLKSKNARAGLAASLDSKRASSDCKLVKLYHDFKSSDEKNFTHRMK